MRKKLSLLIALAISLGVTTTSFAEAATTDTSNTAINATNSTSTSNGIITLTMEDALNSIEKSNTDLKLMNDKVNSLYKQYDIDHNKATSLDTSTVKSGSSYQSTMQQLKVQQLITPLRDEQNVKDQKNAVSEKLNAIRFDLERQYMNVLTCNDQIDNINKTIANIDKQIQQLQEKINVGQATSDSLNTYNVQKSQLLSQINDIKASIDQSLLTIKQYLNIDLDKTLTLSSAKKDFVKFDDTDIVNKINEAVQKDYSLSKIESNINITKQQKDIYTKYASNSGISGEVSAISSLADLQTSLISTNTSLQAGLWSAYYNLKSKENAVQTQILSEESAKDTYNKTKQNFDTGMTDRVSLDSAALALDKQKNLTQRAVNDYMVYQEQFKYMLDGHASAQTSTQSMGLSGIGY